MSIASRPDASLSFVASRSTHLVWAVLQTALAVVVIAAPTDLLPGFVRAVLALALAGLAARNGWLWHMRGPRELDLRERLVRICGRPVARFDEIAQVEQVGVGRARVRLRIGRHRAIDLCDAASTADAVALADRVAYLTGRPVVTRVATGMVWTT